MVKGFTDSSVISLVCCIIMGVKNEDWECCMDVWNEFDVKYLVSRDEISLY
jgi:hypothetical protein